MPADVVVVGGGPTGLAAACELAAGGAHVVVLEAGTIGSGPGARVPGLALPDLLDPWGRVARGLGWEACRELRDFAAGGPVWLRARLGAAAGREVEVRHRPTGRVEADDLLATDACFGAWGVAHRLEADGSLVTPGVLAVDPGALAVALAAEARRAGVEIQEGCGVRAVRGAEAGAVAEAAAGTVTAAFALVTAEASAATIVPALAGACTPWRGQGCTADRGAPPLPVVCNFGHEMYLPLPDGSVACAGFNPSPGLEDCVAEATPTPVFQAFLRGYFARRFPEARGAAFRDPWAAVTAFTPDGLPLVGALPGQPRILVAVGFHGRGLAWGVAAGVALARGILGAAGAAVPKELAPRRLIGG